VAQLVKRIGGFPHSEIRGSKVAHTSPRLIAACHVLHRLYAPRHPRIALTSRLRAHTTNISAVTRQRAALRRAGLQATRVKRAAERLSSGAGVLISARLIRECPASSALAASQLLACSRPTPRGIDFKNPFTMSKRSVSLQYRCRYTADLVSSSRKTQCWWSLSGSNR
jgi:hypothetical protein